MMEQIWTGMELIRLYDGLYLEWDGLNRLYEGLYLEWDGLNRRYEGCVSGREGPIKPPDSANPRHRRPKFSPKATVRR